LHLISSSVSKVVSVRRHLSGLKIFPAILNNLSTGADVAGVAMYFLAALVNNGNLAEFKIMCNVMYYFSKVTVM
jgi:hypothetical protein